MTERFRRITPLAIRLRGVKNKDISATCFASRIFVRRIWCNWRNQRRLGVEATSALVITCYRRQTMLLQIVLLYVNEMGLVPLAVSRFFTLDKRTELKKCFRNRFFFFQSVTTLLPP